MVRDLSDPFARKREQRQQTRRLQSGTPQQNAAVDRGAFTVKSEEGLFVGTESDPTGSQIVYGTLTIIGTLNGDGAIAWTGPWELSGPGEISGDVDISGSLEVTGPSVVRGTFNVVGNSAFSGSLDIIGPLDVSGPWELTGDGDITGDVDLTGDMNVMSGGKIVVKGGGGDVVLNSTFASPRVNLGAAQIDGGAAFTFTSASGTVYFAGGTIRIAAMPTKTTTATGLPAGAVHADTSGNLFRVITG